MIAASQAPVLFAVLQACFVIGAGAGLFALWKLFEREQIAVRVVLVGFIGRAVLSSLLFWISWLQLPFGVRLQLGDGLWFYGLDGRGYYTFVDEILSAWGLRATVAGGGANPAPFFVGMLVVCSLLFGRVVSASLIVNLASYLGMALVVARWANRVQRPREATAALLVLSLFPSMVLWSTQPLKDTFLCFIAILFIARAARFLDALPSGAAGEIVTSLLFMLLLTCVLSGVRWQYSLVLWTAFVAAVMTYSLLGGHVGGRKLRVLSLSSVVLFLLAVGLVDRFRQYVLSLVSTGVDYVEFVRRNFGVLYEPSTRIQPGSLIDGLPFADTIARAAMTFVPRFVTRSVGLASAEGGRGLWVFAEVDTLSFLALCIGVLWQMWRRRPLSPRQRPVLVFLILLLPASMPIAYMIDNFGTLMRFRLLLLLPLCLVPLSLPRKSHGVAEPGAANPVEVEERPDLPSKV